MKKFLLLLFSASISFIANAQKDTYYSDEEIIKIYSLIVEIHNKGLDNVLNNLQKNFGEKYSCGNSKEAHLEMNKKIDEMVKDFVTTELELKDIDLAPFIESYHGMSKNQGADLTTLINSKEAGKGLSEDFFNSISEINSPLDDDKNNSDKEGYDKIVVTGIAKLKTFEEKVYLVSCASMVYSSNIYWKNNFEKWQSFFVSNPEPFIPVAEGRAKDVVKADISGIVTGGIGGCVYGAIGGTATFPGVGTIVGCAGLGVAGALTGGLGGSITSAVNSFLDWWLG